MNVFEATGVDQFYGESHILREAALRVPPGSCTCLMGRNGVGKTTLLKAIMGLLPIRSGSFAFLGKDISSMPAHARARMGIGYVPQGREIFSDLNVEDNLRIGLRGKTVAPSDEGRDASAATHTDGEGANASGIPERLFTLFPVLKKMLRRRGGDLSGGQQQQLAIARALAPGPQLLILDEPTEGIQPNIVHEIGDILLRLREEGLTILLVEQKLPFARRVASHFCLMERGANVAAGAMQDLDDQLVQRFLNV